VAASSSKAQQNKKDVPGGTPWYGSCQKRERTETTKQYDRNERDLQAPMVLEKFKT